MEKFEFGNRILNLVAELSYTVPVQNLSDAHYRKIREITELVYSQCFEDKVAPTSKYIQGHAVFLLHENRVAIGIIEGLFTGSNSRYLVTVPHACFDSEKLTKGEHELFATKQELLDSL